MTGLTQQSADVRFREIDLSQSLRNRSTANGAIIIVSKKGRLGRFNSTTWTDFTNEYGERDASVSFAHYCAYDFLQEADYLDGIRVVGTGAKFAAAILQDNGSGVSSVVSVQSGLADPTNIDWDVIVSSPNIPLLAFTPISGPGSYADDYAISITSENIGAPAAPTVTSSSTGGTLAAATYRYQVAAISANGPMLASTIGQIVIASGSTNTATVTWTAVAGARGYNVYGRQASGTLNLLQTVGADILTLVDTGIIVADTTQPAITDSTQVTMSPIFTVNVFDNSVNTTIPAETWTCTLTDFTDGNGVQLEATQRINPFSSYVQVESAVPLISGTIPTVVSAAKTSLTGGNSGAAPTNGQIASAWAANFGDPEKTQVNILINGGYTAVNVQQAMIALAESRGDAFAVLDMPSTMQKYTDAITYRQLVLNANTSYAAIYSSDPYVSDDYNGKQLFVPPSGAVAAIYARTDRVAGPQYAPAGLNRGQLTLLDLRNSYDDGQRTQLFNAQVNYIRQFVGQGTAVFEQVTLQGAQSALSWVNVRRMINVIKGGVHDYLIYSLHEPNDDFLRKQIVTSLTDYLNYWKSARGLLDFQVISDDTNNPPAKYNLGILTVSIILTPIIPVHEIGVDMIITKAGVSFSEINISALG